MNNDSATQSSANKQPPGKILLWTALGLSLLGLLMAGWGATFVLDANDSRNWPSTTGAVDNVRVTWSTSNTAPDSGTRAREYYYEVYYGYEVGGQLYSGSRYSLGDGSTASDRTWNTEEEAREAASNAYSPSQPIDVYYDPSDPASAVLKTGAGVGTYVPMIFGVALLLVGLLLGWLYLRLRP